jgi:hypothetical protein
MNKREKVERARKGQQIINRFAEIPKEHRDFMLRIGERRNPDLDTTDYRYLRISVEDADTGEHVVPPIYTFRKPREYKAMLRALVNATKWPNELLDGLYWKEYILPGGETIADVTGRQLRDRQILGGRKPGKSVKVKRKRLELARDYWDTQDEYRERGEQPPTYEEFAESREISVSTLKRALHEYQEERE